VTGAAALILYESLMAPAANTGRFLIRPKWILPIGAMALTMEREIS
jgi:hypothetical protein